MPLTDPQKPIPTADGELLAGREALQVPVDVRLATQGTTATLELEAQQTAAPNRTVRLAGLSAGEVRRLRDQFDETLDRLE